MATEYIQTGERIDGENAPDSRLDILNRPLKAFVADLPIGKFHGIGPATEAKMKKLAIETGKDLRQWQQHDLVEKFGKAGNYYYHIVRGIDDRPVRSQRIRKSLGKETTFAEDIISLSEITTILESLAEQVLESLKKHQLTARTLTLKVKYSNFKQVTRAITAEQDLDLSIIKTLLPLLLIRTEAGQQAVRLVGLTVSGFDKTMAVNNNEQLDLGLDIDRF